jgi:hypothetical protein
MATQIANQTTSQVLDWVVEAENAVFHALYYGSEVPAPHAQPEVLQALREARDALHKIRVLAHRLNTAN